MYLKHLQFDAPFTAIDDTSVPITGKVVIGGTSIEDMAEVTGDGVQDGCPIAGAEVCLRDLLATGDEAETDNCVETDSEGYYSISAVIGTHVKIEIN